MLRRRCAEFVDVEEWAVQILERGRGNERSLLFFPCTAEAEWAFEGAIALLARKWYVYRAVYDGHRSEYPGDFTSVEQTVDEAAACLKAHGVTRLDAAYGCSLGGACLTRLLALGEVPVGRAIIDGGIMPCHFAYPLRRLVLLRDVLGFKIAAGSRRMLEAAFPPERFTLPGHDPREEYGAMEAYLRTCSGRTIRNVFWSGNNYRLCGQQCAREGDGTRNPTRCTLPSVFPSAPRRRESARFSESEESARCPDIDATSGRCFLAEFWKCRLSNLGQF